MHSYAKIANEQIITDSKTLNQNGGSVLKFCTVKISTFKIPRRCSLFIRTFNRKGELG